MSLEDLFDRALALPASERDAFIEAQCGADRDLLDKARKLLAGHEQSEADPDWGLSAFDLVSRAPVDPIGERLGAYRIIEAIGAGGMGKVYRAVRADDEYQQSVAIKRIKYSLGAEELAHRFRAERQILADLDHPNLARLLDGGTDSEGLPYLVMEFIDGVPLLDYAREHGLSIEARLRLFRQVCAGVQYAHQHMVVHRDIKPANILVARDGTPKLLDFGIAKVIEPGRSGETLAGVQLFTPGYASPEQVRNEPVTTASDVYSLTVVLYELLTNHSPYGEGQLPTHELMHAVCEKQPLRPGEYVPKLKGDLDNILLKGLHKDPSRRYASVDQLSEDILRHLEGLPVLARGDSFGYLASKFIRRHKLAVGAAAFAVAALAVALAAALRSEARAERRFDELRKLAHSVVFDYHDAIADLPGSTPVRQRIIKDALEYLDTLSKESNDPALWRELVEAYVRISNVQGNSYGANLGDTTGARLTADKAVAAGESLLRSDRSPKSNLTVAGAYSTLASLMYSQGDLPGAIANFKTAIRLGEEVRTVTTAAPDIENELLLADNLRRLGELFGGQGQANLGKTQEALEYLGRALQLRERVPASQQNDARVLLSLAQTLEEVGSAQQSLGQDDQSVQQLQQAIGMYQRLVDTYPAKSQYQVGLVGTRIRLATMWIARNQPAKAVLLFTEAIPVMERVAASDPKNVQFQRDLSVLVLHFAIALRKAHHYAESLAQHERALALASTVLQADPTDMEFRTDVALAQRQMAASQLAAGDANGALARSETALGLLRSILAGKHEAMIEGHIARALVVKAEAQANLRQEPAATATFREAESASTTLWQADPSNAFLESDLARAATSAAVYWRRLGKHADAQAAFDRARKHWDALRGRKALTEEDAALWAQAASFAQGR